jgi:predicted transcriptional regulator YdeE
MLIKIGDFANLMQVTVKALRHYERLGLLNPAWINRYNGYRFYAPEQAERLEQVKALKNMGFTLNQIARLLDDQLKDVELHRLFQKRKEALLDQIQKDQERLEMITACLARVDRCEGCIQLARILSNPVIQQEISKEEQQVDIKIQTIPDLKLVGMRYQGQNEHQEISDTWTIFNRRAREIKHLTHKAAYGVCRIPPGLPEGEFEYICALPVSEMEDIPEGMLARSLPSLKVAVFEHHGALETLGETYTSIYQKWLPEAGLKPLENGFDMEMYDEKFKDFAPDSVMYIYVPVKD